MSKGGLRNLRALFVALGVALAVLPGVPGQTAARAELTQDIVRTWGVVGLGPDVTTRIPSQVWALEQIGNTIYVGGRFTHVVERRDGTHFAQPYLAAFDATSGDWIDWWRPDVAGSVLAMEASPDGTKLFIGGEFSSVNGHPMTSGVAAIDPATGNVDPTWRAGLDRRFSSLPALVRDMDIGGDHLFVAGNFTHVSSPPGFRPDFVSKAAKLSLTDGSHDPDWEPTITGGPVWGMAASPDGNRVYLGGTFESVNGESGSSYFWTVDGTTGATVDGLEPLTFNDEQRTVFDIEATDDRVFVAGSQHYMRMLDADDHTELQTYFTGAGPNNLIGGGDYQDIEIRGNRAYLSCHCWESIYDGTQFVADVAGVFVIDATSGDFLASWPDLPRGVTGPWALHEANDGCLWNGGDMNLSVIGDQYVNGIVKICDEAGPGPGDDPLEEPPDDTTAPSEPGKPLRSVSDHTTVNLDWADATDDTGVVHYNVYHKQRLVGSTPISKFSFTEAAGGPYRYRVSAVDGAGNESTRSNPSNRVTIHDPPGSFATLFADDFSGQTTTFTYADDAFRGTNEPDYASGEHQPWAGHTGGGLKVHLGGVDDDNILGMSGAYSTQITLNRARDLTISFRYNVIQAPLFENDEYTEALFAFDGTLIGSGAGDYLARASGGEALSWSLFEADLGTVAAGTHTITLGGYGNKKTFSNEFAEVTFDDVVVASAGPGLSISGIDEGFIDPPATVPIELAALDLIDAPGSLSVDVRTGAQSDWQPAAWDEDDEVYRFDWDTTVHRDGPLRLSARARDDDGNETRRGLDVFVDRQPDAYRDAVLADDPVAFWRLAEDGGATGLDHTGNGLDAAFVGTPSFGRNGLSSSSNDALGFTGNDNVDLPSSDAIDGPITSRTIELWMRTADTRRRAVLYEEGSTKRGLSIYVDDGRVWAGAWNKSNDGAGTPWGAVFVNAPLSEGVSHHIVAVIDGDRARIKLFVDGVRVASRGGIGPIHERGDSAIGGINAGTRFKGEPSSVARGKRLIGTIDDVAIYSTALSSNAIARHRAAAS